jgi:hypothetical protein
VSIPAPSNSKNSLKISIKFIALDANGLAVIKYISIRADNIPLEITYAIGFEEKQSTLIANAKRLNWKRD